MSAPTPVLGTTPSAAPPSRAPATSSPSTAGCPMRSASSPSTFAAMRMAARARNSLAMSTLERLHDARTQHEGLLEQRKIHRLAVLGLDGDFVVAAAADDAECGGRAQQRIGLRREPGADDLVRVLAGEDGLLLHVVLELIEPPVDPADVDSIVGRCHEQGRADEAAERAG